MKSVLVAMSGGVDSSVAAALLKEEGYRVIGATMKIWDEARERKPAGLRTCCSLTAVEDAMAVCEVLSIPYRLLEYQDFFRAEIVEDFCEEYLKGRTPNPCILCNTRLKFRHFLREAETLGCDFMATGHYARIERDADSGKFLLKRGKDRDKDQSYFLYGVTQEVLSKLLFPVGKFTKAKIRERAASYRLPVAEKKESQDICFIPDNDYAGFLKRRFPEAWKEGTILDLKGHAVGKHPGHMHFTIGQRRGVGVAHAEPLYVVKIRAAENVIVVGRKKDLLRHEVLVHEVHWISGAPPAFADGITAKIRYRHKDAEVELRPRYHGTGSYRVLFKEPQEAVTPGQSMVFYLGETVLGGGMIEPVEM